MKSRTSPRLRSVAVWMAIFAVGIALVSVFRRLTASNHLPALPSPARKNLILSNGFIK